MAGQKARRLALATMLTAAIGLSVTDDARAAAADDPLLLTVILDQIETRDIGGENTLSWDAEGWLILEPGYWSA